MADSRFATGLGLAMLAGVVLTLAWAIAALLTVEPGGGLETTYAATLPAARVADLAAGLGLLAAGALAATQPRTRRLGLLALLAGLAWFGADWEGAQDAPALLRRERECRPIAQTAIDRGEVKKCHREFSALRDVGDSIGEKRMD